MKLLSSLLVVFLCFLSAHAQKNEMADFQSKLNSHSLFYQENKGQIVDTKGESRPDVLFTSYSNGVRTYYKRDGISYVFEKVTSSSKPMSLDMSSGKPEVTSAEAPKVTTEMHRIDLKFVGSNPYCGYKGEQELEIKDNFYLGKFTAVGVKTFKKVVISDLYDKIDLVLYSDSEKNLKYDFIVHPGGDPSQIKMEIDGTDDYGLTAEGIFFLGSKLGKITESSPVSFQSDKTAISSSFQLENDILSFKLGTYDKTQDLIIDPTRQWGTYYTADNYSEWSYGQAICSDATGVYFVINTNATSYPPTAGVFDPSYNGGFDLRIAKFSSAGVLLWGSYFGGSSDDLHPSVAIGTASNLILTGSSISSDLPVTAGTYDQSTNGGWDFFVSQWNSTNGTLSWGTFLGGSSDEFGANSVDLTSSNEIVLLGTTYSSDFPVMSAFDASVNGGLDVILAKFSTTGNLVTSTYLGTGSDDVMSRQSLSVGPDDNIGVLLQVYTGGLPTTAGVFGPAFNGGSDLYLCRFNNAISAINYGTYIGDGFDQGYPNSGFQNGDQSWYSLATCSDNSVIVGGVTWSGSSNSWAATAGAYQNTYSGNFDSYVIKFNTTGARTWGTTWGGFGYDWIQDVEVDQSDNVFILTGHDGSLLPTTPGAFQTTPAGGWDKHIAQLSSNGSTLLYGTHLGSNDYDMPEVGSLSFASGSLYIGYNSNFNGFNAAWNTSAGSYQPTATGGGFYPIVNKFLFCDIATSGVVTNVTCGNTDGAVNLTATSSTETPLTYSWSNSALTEDISALSPGAYTVTVTGGVTGCTVSQTFAVGLNDAIAPTAVCQNYTATLDGTGNVTITAANVNNGSSDNCGIASMSVSPNAFDCGDVGANTVTLTVTDFNGNTATCTATVTVTETTPPVIACPSNITTTATGACTATVTYTAPTATDNCGSGNPTLENVLSGFNTNYNTVFTNIPSPVVFAMDNGVNGNSISDGYSDMYDGGNFLNTNLATNIPYSDNTIVNSGNFGAGGRYFTRYITNGGQGTLNPCMFVMAADINNISNFNIQGNNGADGGGNVDGAQFSITVSGQVYNCFVKRVYNAFDPSINQLMIVPNNPALNQTFSTNSNDGNHFINNLNASTRIYYLLYSSSGGGYINNAQTQVIATSFINAIGAGNVVTVTQTAGLASGASFPVGTTTNTFQAMDAAGNTSTCSFTVTVNDTQAPLVGIGDGTLANPFTTTSASIISAYPSGNYYFNINGSVFLATVDNTTAGGGWILVLNYVHQGGTNPNLNVRSTDLPVQTGATLGADESGSAAWGHAGNTLMNAINPTELRFFGQTSAHGRIMNFTTSYANAVNYAKSGTGSFAGINAPANYTLLAGHTALLPQNAVDNFSNQGNLALTEFPFWLNSTYHWGIKGAGTRWEMDDFPGNASSSTIHRVWGRNSNAPVAAPLPNVTAECSVTPPTPTAVDDCSGIVSGTTSTSFPISTPGTTVVTWTFTDGSGNSVTQNQNVTINDVTPPTITCPANISTVGTSAAGATVTYSLPTVSDNCGSTTLSQTAGLPSGSTFPIGTTTNTFLVTDGAGLTATCSFTVTITGVPPSISCPANITTNNDAGLCTAVVTFAATDAGVPASTITYSHAPGSAFPVGTTTVTATATNPLGSSSCTFDITVEDNEAPTAVCQNYTLVLDATGNGTITPANIDNGSSDNCNPVALSLDVTDFNCSNVGTNTVTLTVTESTASGALVTNAPSGLIGHWTFEPGQEFTDLTGNWSPLTINGSAAVTGGQLDVDAAPNGWARAVGYAGAPISDKTLISYVSLDNFNQHAGSPLTIDAISYDQFDGLIYAESWPTKWQNGSSGGSRNQEFMPGYAESTNNELVQIALTYDVTGPNVLITGYRDGVLMGSYTSGSAATWLGGDVEMLMGIRHFMGLPIGAMDAKIEENLLFNRSLTQAEIQSMLVLSSTCTATVTVQDNTPPTAICQNLTVNLDATGNVAITPAMVNNGSNDACGIASMTLDNAAFTCANVGTNTVTLTVTDVNGNVSTCTSTITVQDNIAPTAICQNLTVNLDATGNISITPAMVNNGSSDNCGIASLALDQTAFTCANVGTNTVTLTVTDVNGNVSTCTAIVTVQDNIAPTAICQNLTVNLDATGNVTITPAMVDNGSNDNCGIASLALDQTTFTCAEEGTNTVTLTVTDANGNTSTCTATVTVVDVTAPTISCQDITVPLDATGNATILPTDVLSSASYIVDQSGSYAPVPVGGTQLFLSDDVTTGMLPVGFNFTFFGNTYNQFVLSSNGFISFDPLVSNGCCQGGIIPTNDGVNNVIAFSWNDLYPPGGGSVFYETVGTAPNRKLVVSFTNIPHFATSNPDHTSQIILYETSNLVEIHSATITDDGSLHTMGIENFDGSEGYTVPGRNSSNWTTNNDYVAFIPSGSAQDACGIASITLDQSTFNCTDVGTNTVTVTATDVNGNVSTCTSTVTIQDVTPPNVICQNLTVNLDATGNATITPAMVDNGSSDACGIASMTLDNTAFTCANVGTNTVTLTVTDVNGNVSTCTATITVQDNIAPNAICQNLTVNLDAAGNGSITPAMVDNGSNDNCGIASMTLDNTTFTCANVGTNTVTLTVTDVNGNVSTCTATITVQDNIAPNAICQNLTVNLDAAGNGSITPAMVDNGSNDNCGIASLALDQTAFTCANVGTNTVTLTVTDVNGNVSTCTATITVQDNIAPNAICQNLTVNLDAAGNGSITPAMVDNGSNDNCGIASMTLDNTTFTCANVGTNTVTLTVTDVNGNVSTCTSTITVQDNIAPNAICQNLTVNLDAAGNGSITPAMVDNGSNDNCGIASLALDQTAFTCVNVGTNTVTLTVTDVNGNVSTCTSTITVQDIIAPNAICQNVNAYLDATGNVSITTADIDNGSNDNCGIATMTLDKSAFVCSDLGANAVVLTVTDVNGNVSTCSSTVTVFDTITPAFTSTQANITVNNVTGVCGKVVTYPTPTFADNCTSTMTQTDGTGLTSGDLFPVGTTTQTYTVTDAGGNTEVLTFTITVLDIENPVISNCPANITVSSSSSACGNNVNWTMPTVSDNCPGAVMISSHTPGSFFPVGTTTVTYNATDASGNTATCTFTVTVNDNVAPVVPVLATVTGECSATVTAPTTTDNCSGTITGTTTDPLTYSTQGTHTVTWSFVDGAGNTSTATQTVVVDDVTAPVVPVLATVTGECSATVTAPTTTDNCSGTITGTTTDPLTYTAQGTYTVTWSFNDGNGNTSTATQLVVVNDVTPPTAVCQPFTVNLDATGNATITAANVNNGSSDNCGIASMTVSPSTFDCSNVGTNTVTLTVTDINGNVSTCTSTVTVVDVTPLTWATTPANITVTAAPSLCGRTVNYALPTYSDNCPATMTQTDGSGYTSGDVFPVGTTTQTYTVTNGAGETITHTFTVTVQDLQAPVIANCPANITVNTATTTCGTNVSWSAPVASDNCSGVVMSTTNAPGTFFPVGTTTVTYTATDASGNTATCVFTVTVNDNVAPEVPVLATVTGECSATVTAPTAMDACSGAIVGTTADPLTYTTQGTYTVTWSFVDGAGNTSTATQTVIVDDVTAPVVPVLATVTGECSATVTAPTTTDNCSGTITGTTTDPLTYSAQGTYTITWTFNDGNGNTSTATQLVVVNDVTPPTAVCQNFTVNLSASGNASIIAANINNGSSDNCGIASVTVSPSTFDCSNVGANTVTLTVTDINGNVSTCTSTVTVVDVTPLVFVTTPSNMTVNAIPGFCGRTVNYTLPTYSDNCPATMTQTDGSGYTSGDVFPVGTTTQTYTVTNGSGQTITHSFTITVVDTQFPVIASCPANITVNTSTSTCGTNVTWSAPTASDNCPGVILTSTNAPGSFFPVGTTTVTYTATDNSGNVSLCTFNVTVIDNVAPVVPVLATTVTGECSATVTAPTATDACSGAIVGTTTDPLTYTTQGTYTVTWSFVDGAGNTSTTTQTVIVDDVTAPVVPVLATVTGECSATVTAPTTTDNCSGTITGTTTDPLTYSTQGTHTVTWSFNDGNGNTSTATQTVVIDDITAPVVPVLADVTGECSATATAPTTTDNCGGTVTGTTTDPLTYSTQGTHVITWTFDDGNGNMSTATQNVVINDVTAPTITAAADTVVDANYFGCSALDLVLTSPVTNDNCSVVSVTNDAPNPLPFGNTTVTWTVTDINGNTTTDQQVVTVTSNITATVDTITCDSYTAPDGTIYTSTGTYTATILSYLGCDSVITVNLTILNSTTSSITIDACDTYTAPDGEVYNNSGIYTAIIPNAAGCDSIITVNLTIHTLNLNVLTQQDGTELVAVETGVTYQWFNCLNDSIVAGATSQTFVPTLTSDYSVILSDGVCIDTTDCYNISLDVVIPEVISPNGDGKNDVFEIIGIEDYPQNHLTIFNRWGQVVFETDGYMNEWNGTNQSPGAIATDELPVGTYFYVLDLGPSDDIYVGQVYKGYVYLTR